MSHPAWPSMAFSTYDWYGDTPASYYACRKACEPLHIQWNPVAERVEVVNYSAGAQTGLRAVATLHDLYGAVVSTQETTLDAQEDSTTPLHGIDFSAAGFAPGDTASAGVCFLRLQLFDGDRLVSLNDYVIPQKEDDLKVLNSLPQVSLKASFSWDPATGLFVANVTNPSDAPALMIHLSALDKNGERHLPALWSDNYFHLMPGEERTLTLRLSGDAFAYSLRIAGFNVKPLEVSERKHREVVE